MSLIGVEKRTTGIEMVNSFSQPMRLFGPPSISSELVSSTGRVVGKQVSWPSNQLLYHELDRSTKRHFLGKLPIRVFGFAGMLSVLFAGLGYKLHVLDEVVVQGMVLFVGQLPGEVRDQEGRMQDPASNVVQGLGVGKGAVAAFMRNHPDPNPKQTLEKSVERPKGETEVPGRYIRLRYVRVEDVKGENDKREVLDNITKPGESRFLEATCWDNVFDLLEAVFRNLELVAIGVYQLAVRGSPAFVTLGYDCFAIDRSGQDDRACIFLWREKLGLSKRHGISDCRKIVIARNKMEKISRLFLANQSHSKYNISSSYTKKTVRQTHQHSARPS